MSVRRTARVLVTSLTTAALATTGLVAMSAAPAAAEPVEATYTCTFPLFDELDVTLTLDVPELPAELPVGIPVPDGTWDVEGLLALPDLVLTLLLSTVGVSGTTDGLELLFGEDLVPVDLAAPLGELPLLGDIELPLDGANREFVPTQVGRQAVALPDTFVLHLLDDLGVGALDVSCEFWDENSEIGTVDVVKQRSTLNAQVLKKPIKVGKRAKVLVSVLNQLNRGAAGEVVATVGGKKVGSGVLTKGTAKLRIPGLPVGKHRVKLTYSGTETVAKAVKTVTVKVVKRRS